MTTELDRLQAENERLRDALRRIDDSSGIVRRDVSLGIEGGDEADWAEVQDLARAALAATPPAAEPAGQGEQQEDGACTSCGGSGKRDHLGHACVPCFGTGKQQEVL